MFTKLPLQIYVDGVGGYLNHSSINSNYHYYFSGCHSATVKKIRASLGDMLLTLQSIGLDPYFTNCLHNEYAFPEFERKSDLLVFVNHLVSVGLVSDQDSYERSALGIKR